MIEGSDIKQQLIDHLSNPDVIISEFTIDASGSDGIKLSFSCVTIDLQLYKDKRHDNFVRIVKDTILR